MRDLDRFLGNGGMPLLDDLGVAFIEYGEGWSRATWTVAAPCTNPAGFVQAGVYSVALDAAMYFALVASLASGESGATLHMDVQTVNPARADDVLEVRGEVTHIARSVAFCAATITRDATVIASASGTFAVKRSN